MGGQVVTLLYRACRDARGFLQRVEGACRRQDVASKPPAGLLSGCILGGMLLVLTGPGCLSIRERDTGEVRRRVVAEQMSLDEKGQDSAVADDGAPLDQAAPTTAIFAEDAGELELHSVLLYALDHSPRIEAARYRLGAAEAREQASGWLPDPQFQWTHGFEETETRNGPIDDVFSLTQTFPYWGKLAGEHDMATERASAGREELLAVELEVLRDVQRSYFGIYRTEREILINEETTEIFERFVRVAQQKVAAGRGGQPDILLAEIELFRLENEKIDLDQRLMTEKALLNTLLDRKPGAHLPSPSLSDAEYQTEVDGLISWMLENLPDLRRHRHVVEENRARLRVARLRYVPDVTVGVSYGDVGRSSAPAGAIDSGSDVITGMVGINLPLWIPKYSAEARAASRALHAARSELRDAELLAVYRVMEMHVRVETALRQVNLLEDVIVPKAEQTVTVLETAYEGGTLDFLKLLDAERALERFELELEQARVEFEQRLADLERAVGKPLRQETRS